MSNTINTIAKGFENWINKDSKNKVSVFIDYRDEQTLAIKAYHKVHADLVIIGIHKLLSFNRVLVSVEDTYNHGVTTEEEAKEKLMEKLLEEMFSCYCNKGIIN